MEVWQAVILGITQGFTEFLPVSSSGHLVLVQNVMGLTDIPLCFDTMLHFGTLVAVLVVMFREMISVFAHPIKKHFFVVVIATVPAAVIGYVFNDAIGSAYSGSLLGICFIATAAIIILGEMIAATLDSRKDISWKSGLVMGGMQALALFPGISRSGSVISGGLYCGVDRKITANYAFLMSIPIILGSAIFEGAEFSASGAVWDVSAEAVAAGVIAAGVTGFIAVKFMLMLVAKKRLYGFAIYTAALGTLVLIDQGALHLVF